MPEGKTMTFSVTEYPKLEGLKEGDPFMVRAEGKVMKADQVQVEVKWDSFDIETENKADKDLKEMKSGHNIKDPDEMGEDDF